MRSERLKTPVGHANVLVADDKIDPSDLVEECLKWTQRTSGRAGTIGGVLVVMKGGPLAPSGARRHSLRRALLRAPAPCEAEFRNLRWLQQRLFRVPDPIGAVTVFRTGRPVRQLLATRPVGGATPIDAAWSCADDRCRCDWATELGREIGRMHALRFLHGDLYPRNVLAAPIATDGGPGHGRSLVWIDAWAGGPTAWRRGSLRRVEQDLGAWFSAAADWMNDDEQAALLVAYVRSRAQNGRPVQGPGRLVARIQGARRVELARLERDRRRLRGGPFPVAGWDLPLDRLAGSQSQ